MSFAWFRDRIEAKGAAHGLVYAWWIPVVTTLGLVGGAVAGAAQRVDSAPAWVLVLAVALTAGPCVSHFALRTWLPWWVEVVCATSGVVLLLAHPVPAHHLIDIAPIVLVVAVGEATATDGGRRGVAAAVVAGLAIVWVGERSGDLTTLYLAELLVGLVLGYMLRWQMRALAAEQAARREERERATLAERQRVAREIHDLVAHSLSVTMLHVTGARRALEQDADIPDAIEALTDAERIGREAMADIRRTVGVLRTEQTGVRPLPGAGDLDALVADVRGAGLEVDWRCTGDPARLGPTAGLGVYRVAQESLANVVRHAPGAPATVRLDVAEREATLSVTNPVLAGAVVGTDGSGIAGMASRVDQLGGVLDVGAAGSLWRVRLTVPVVPG